MIISEEEDRRLRLGTGASLVAQWLKICLLMQRTRVRITGSSPGLGGSHMPQSNKACEPQLLSLRIWSPCSATREAVTVRGPRTVMKSGPHLPQLEKALAQKWRPNTAKNKINKQINLKKKKKKKKTGHSGQRAFSLGVIF